jgi:HEAT repeat protein
MKVLAVSLLAIAVLPGCGSRTPPLSGGKPASYRLAALQDGDAKVRQKAVTKLGNAGDTDPAVFPALLEAIKDTDACVRRASVLALMKFGPDAKQAVPMLTDVQRNDQDAEVRAFARKALARLGSHSTDETH